MNFVYLLFSVGFFLPVCYSQNSDSNIIRIDAFPASGILLDKGWKFHTGDDPQRAKPELGLSLAYDIIKAHGGEIKVETGEGQGTTFFIQLPST